MALAFILCGAVLLGTLATYDGRASAQTDPPSALRLGVASAVNLNTAFQDAATGQVRGVGADLAAAFAAETGRTLEPVLYVTTPAILSAMNEGAWDVSVQPLEQAQAAEALYAGSYMAVEQTYLVPEDSPFHRVADLDRPGVRIMVNRATPADAQLTRLLAQAELQRSDTPGTGAAEPLFAGEVEAYAFNREGLLGLAEQRVGYRVVEDNFAVTELGIVAPPGQEALQEQLHEFLERAKGSGLIQQTIDANGVRGVQVAALGQ